MWFNSNNNNLESVLKQIEDNMVLVKGGTFTMGATAEQGECFISELPVHQVTLSDFYISKYEVTQEQWKAIMGKFWSSFKGANLPIEDVSWDTAQEFIEIINEKTGKKYRLPTEAEWEFAARGGNMSRGYKFSGSNDLECVAWYAGNSREMIHPVGTKDPNELGLFDMNGNVYEWCQDRYASYTSEAQINPKVLTNEPNRVIRGGSWGHEVMYCRVSCRESASQDRGGDDVGFRLARSI